VALVNQSMTGARRIPDTREQVGVLYGFLAGDPSVDQLVTSARTDGLLIVRIAAEDINATERVLRGVEGVVAQAHTTYAVTTGPAAQAWLHAGGVPGVRGELCADPGAGGARGRRGRRRPRA
jgi:hypothetical protein